MTIIVGCNFKEGAILLADSRATWEDPKKQIFSDTLQKIIPLGRKLGIAYAGNVAIADRITRQIKQNIKKNPRLTQPLKLFKEVTRIAKHHYQKYGKSSVSKDTSLILGAVDTRGKIYLWRYDSPGFIPKEITSTYTVAGSGGVVKAYLEKNYQLIENDHKELKSKADVLRLGLESELRKYGVDSVGGFFQIVMLSSDGIRPMQYGYYDIDPEGPAEAKSITMKKGKWVQRDETEKKDVKIVVPHELINAGPNIERFHEYQDKVSTDGKAKVYLSYFITCIKVDKQPSYTKFEGPISQVGSHEYPIRCPLVASLGFWGTGHYQGVHDLEFRLDSDGEFETLNSEKINIQYLPDRFEVDTLLSLEISSPGSIFLECLIDGQVVARKALYFDIVEEKNITNKEDQIAFMKEVKERLMIEHRKYSDRALKTKNAILEHFIICKTCDYEDGSVKFSGEIKAVYWGNYPLLLKIFISTSCRFSKGKHNARLDLRNVATGETSNISNTVVESSGECISSPGYGEFVIKILNPGMYMINFYVDDDFMGSALLPCEEAKGKYSYSLREEDEDKVMAGELFFLLQRSKRADVPK